MLAAIGLASRGCESMSTPAPPRHRQSRCSSGIGLGCCLLILAFWINAVSAQGRVGQVRVDIDVPTDVPNNVAFTPSQWSVTPTQAQEFRITLTNPAGSGSTEPIDVDVSATVAANELDFAIMPGCNATPATPAPRLANWWVGSLADGISVSCSFLVRATAGSPSGVRIFRASARMGSSTGGTLAVFVLSPVDLVNADLALTLTNPNGLSRPGTIQRIGIEVRNNGPDAHAPFGVAFGSYSLALTNQTPTPDPFRIIGTTDPACNFVVTTIGSGDPVFASTSIGLPTIPPGQSRSCEVLVEVLPTARGSRSLPVILTHWGVGVVESTRLNNSGAMRLTFTAEPVPFGDERCLWVGALLMLLAGVLRLRSSVPKAARAA